MSANQWGHLFRFTSFGESHGHSMGVVIDGCPAGVKFDEKLLVDELKRRRPGQSATVSARGEQDYPQILSGVFEGVTLGTPIAMVVKNKDQQSTDYDKIKDRPRTGHADAAWKSKFVHVDHRGGGRSSGRETVSRVMAGSVAQMFLSQVVSQYRLSAFATQIGPYELSQPELEVLAQNDLQKSRIDSLPGRFPYKDSKQIEKLLLDAKAKGHSYGGKVKIWIEGVPQGLGEPVFHKLKSELTRAYMSIGAISAVELGDGVSASFAEGSQYHAESRGQYGGIQGGISTGERIEFNCYFKPTSSVMDVAKKGRHDPCIIPRAIPVLESMTHVVLADMVLWSRLNNI